jgi:hypothetical protein
MAVNRRWRAALPRLISAGLVAVFAIVAYWNARDYPPIGGYDAAEHITYAHELVEHWTIAPAGASYTPPGFYLLAGGATRIGERLELDEPERAALYMNALLGVGTALLLVVMGSLLFPGRPVVRWAALGFFLCCPIVLKATAMFHPQPLVLFLSTLALTLTTWMIVRRRYTWPAWAGLALTLAAAQLVRSVSLVTVAVVLVTLVVTAMVDLESRKRIRNALLAFAVVVVAVPLPWYVHLKVTTSSAIFGRPSVTSSVLGTSWPAAFYVSPGLPSVITEPHRSSLPPRLIGTLYADTWGDYFGIWSWGPPRPELTPEVNRRLKTQSLVGLPLTALAVAGWLALAALFVRRRGEQPARLPVVLMPVAAVAAVLFYSTQAPHPDGDTVKALFLLPAVPAWALSFGFALDVLLARSRRVGWPLVLLLTACGLVSLAYATFATVS